MDIHNDQEFSVTESVLFQEIGGETVLLDLASEKYFGLDPVGTRVWKLLNDGQGYGGMIEILLDEYEVEREQLEKDVRDLLGSLLEAGLIQS